MEKILLKKYILLAFVWIVGFSSCSDMADIPEVPNIHSVSIDKSSVSLMVEDAVVLVPKFNSVKTYQMGYKWTVSNPEVASVEYNETDYTCSVVALKLGETEVKIESLDGAVSATCEVVVDREPFILKNPIYMNFGYNAPAPWNNLTDRINGVAFNRLKDAIGERTEVNLQLQSTFDWITQDNNDIVTDIPLSYLTIPVPVDVSFWAFQGLNWDEHNMMEFSGLRSKQKYDITFFATKASWGDVCSVRLKVKGDGEQHTLTLLTKKTNTDIGTSGEAIPEGRNIGAGGPAEKNTTIRVGKVSGIYPTKQGTLSVDITSGAGGSQPTGIYFINAMWITPAAE